MPDNKRTSASKRTKPIREFKRSPNFLKDWERLERSGKHDMHRLKEAMLLLIANDGPLPPEWKDHKLHVPGRDIRECHVKGDLLLVYRLQEKDYGELITFLSAGTHSGSIALRPEAVSLNGAAIFLPAYQAVVSE